MILRDYQEKAVASAEKALATEGNQITVGATGSGKTVMLSELSRRISRKTLIIQHRDELVDQNISKYKLFNPNASISIVNAKYKDFDGDAVFAMTQTLSRHTEAIPRFHHVIIDEAHHATAESNMKILRAVREQGPILLSGYTATPARGDGYGLHRAGFTNCCADINITDLVGLGYLVRPRAYKVNLVDLGNIPIVNGEYDLDLAAEDLNVEVHNRTVVEKWREKAEGRRTVVFCCNVKHAEDVTEEFVSQGYNAVCLTGETPKAERAKMLQADIICNVAVLTEGWDDPEISCVVLLRPCSYKGTMIQMVGRGLRIADGKADCIVLDFGQSLETHGDLVSSKGLGDKDKKCPQCGSSVPPGTTQCQLCGFSWERQPGGKEQRESCDELTDVEMIEVDILQQSPFRWVDLFDSGKVMIATGFNATVFTVSKDGNTYYAIGVSGKNTQRLYHGPKHLCLSQADDFLRQMEESDAAKKTKRWLRDPPSPKQLELLSRMGYDGSGMTKYQANCFLNFGWNQWKIEKILMI